MKESVVAEGQRQRKTQEKGRLKTKEDKDKEEKEQHCERRRVLQFEGMAEGCQKRYKRVVTGVTRGEEWPHTVANVVT